MDEVVKPVIINDRSILTGDNASYRNKNLFIEAGAGAGKTNYIITKIVDELLQGIEPKRFVVITFTNKATEEMLSRIISDITKLANDESRPKKEREVLQNAKDKLFEMNVSTIHSFCNTLLNENSFSSKLAFGAKLIEEDEDKKRMNKAFSEWLKTLNPTENYELFGISAENLLYKVKSTYENLCDSFDNVQYDDDYTYDYSKFFDACTALYDFIMDSGCVQSSLTIKFVDAYDILSPKLIKGIDSYISNYDSKTIKEIKALSKSINKNMSLKGLDEADKDEFKELKEETSTEKNLIDIYLDGIYTPIINKYAIKAWNYFKEHRDRETLSNNQLIYEAYKLLQDDEVCERIAKNYDVIFIDEFQDTDKCQIEFIIKLARTIDERKKKEGNNTTSLVVVGDPKQSIYRFRGADFESFSKVRNSFASYGSNYETILFPDNFRSNNYVINYVNEIFKTKNLADNYEYNEMKVSPINIIDKNLTYKNFLAGVYSYPFAEEQENKFENLDKFIKYLVDTKYLIAKKYKEIIDGKQKTIIKYEQVGYEDFLVLTCSHAEMNEYIQALNAFNIPSQIAGEFNLNSSKVIRIVSRLIRYLLDKQENNKYLALNMLSSYVGDPLTSLEELEKATEHMSCYGKLMYVLNNLEIIIDEFGETDEILYRTIKQQILEKICVNEFISDSELINKLEDLLEEPAKSQIALDPSCKAVRIMNVHQSKGLEGHIVIIADSGGFANDGSCKLCKSKLYLNNTKIKPDIDEEISKESTQEKVRLEYVAATRAEQVLIFDKKFKGGRLFNLSEDNNYDFSDETLLRHHFPGSVLPSKEDVNEHFDEDIEISKGVKITFKNLDKIDSSLLEKDYENASPSLLEDHSDQTERVIEPRRPYDNIFGTTFHRVMELYALNEQQDIDDIVNKAINENINDIDISDVDKYKLSLKECLLSVEALYKSKGYLDNAKEKKPEFKFIDYDSSIYGNTPTLMSGSIDLLLVNNDDSITIIDYKTDIAKFHNVKQFEELLQKTYSNQLVTYSKLINKIYKTNNIKTKIVWMEEKGDSTVAHELDIKK